MSAALSQHKCLRFGDNETGGIIDGSGVAKGVAIDSGRETRVRFVSMKNVLVVLEDPHLSESKITEGDRSYLHYLRGCSLRRNAGADF